MNIQDANHLGNNTALAAAGEQTVRAPQREGLLQESDTKIVLPDHTLQLNYEESLTIQQRGIPGNFEHSQVPLEGKDQMNNAHLGESSQIGLQERRVLLNGVGADSINMSQTEQLNDSRANYNSMAHNAEEESKMISISAANNDTLELDKTDNL